MNNANNFRVCDSKNIVRGSFESMFEAKMFLRSNHYPAGYIQTRSKRGWSAAK